MRKKTQEKEVVRIEERAPFVNRSCPVVSESDLGNEDE